ncbi:hypothetical protein ARALYDRAFT_338390 [Arabidopsis lyrata subsp. lyrata]|uniref:MADS-box domain-containing protein n=1 Tax=Arabidopsis lyrata subsp. lyrata TaxID=81972 RepID=D7KXQ5_ARALL|nr:hypothetical protein ARALYDRAFT_338390 [Arabidopsis lyrata subsp. lyrata]
MAPRDKKPNKSCDDDDLQRKKKQNFFKQRFPGFKKKATELSVLCGNSVGFICYGPDNDLHVWPQPQDHNPQTLTQIVAKFNALSDHKRKHHACDLYDFPNLKGLSGDQLRNHLVNLDSHLVGVKQHKINSSLLDPFTLGFSGHDYFLADSMAVTDNWEVCANNGVWDPSWLDFDFSSTLFTDDWTVSGYNPLLAATDSFTYETPVTDNLGSVF